MAEADDLSHKLSLGGHGFRWEQGGEVVERLASALRSTLARLAEVEDELIERMENPEADAVITGYLSATESCAHLHAERIMYKARAETAEQGLQEAREALGHYHEWLERVEKLRVCPACGRRGFMGLDHAVGENVQGCIGCATLTDLRERDNATFAVAPMEHFSRNWGRDVFAPGCGCQTAPCGFVVRAGVNPECEQHPSERFKTIRAGHSASQCPESGGK